jgi:hypothetical protein
MARILVDNTWYEQMDPSALYESEFENLVLEQAPLLYPEFYAIPFKPVVFSEDDAAKPDFVLIDKEYRNWWVVEVEMIYHSLTSHVLPQIKTLSQATYGEQEAILLSRQDARLHLEKLRDMMKGKQPQVLVVLNASKSEWIAPLMRYDAILSFCEVFRSITGRWLLRVDGAYPQQQASVLSSCYVDPIMRQFLVVESPASLDVRPHQRVRIFYEGGITEWERIDSQDTIWLNSLAINPLSPKQKYDLLRRSDGEFVIQQQERKRSTRR